MNPAAARRALRHLDRRVLLILLERALETLPAALARSLLAGFVPDETLASAASDSTLLQDVRTFVDAALAREFYDELPAPDCRMQPRSRGTDAFFAELDRLERHCIAAGSQVGPATLESIELLFDLVRRIDDDPDAIVFFADEPGAWQLGVNWRQLLPAYFRCLAVNADPEAFAERVRRAIDDFARFDRPGFVDAALAVARPEQHVALRRAMEASSSR